MVTTVPPLMTAEQFRLWRDNLGFTQVAAAAALSLSERAIKHYEAGTRGVSRQIAQHCAAISRRRRGGTGASSGNQIGEPKPNDVATPLHGCQRLYAIISPHYKPKVILDPAAGDGRLTAPWKKSRVIAFDIKHGTDFLAAQPISGIDLVLCNPPFNSISHNGSRLGSEVFLRQIIEVAGHVPTALFTPMGFRLNTRATGKRGKWLASLNITSVISLPVNFFEATKFHSELLLFNMPRLKPHYTLTGG